MPSHLPLKFLDFVRVSFLMDLSKSLPPNLVGLDDQWPQSCRAFQQASDLLREMYRAHLAQKFMKKLTPEDKTQVLV